MTGPPAGLLGMIVASATGAAAEANTVTFAYEGVIENVAGQLDETFSVGQKLRGTFTFDPTTPDTASCTPNEAT